MKQRTLKVHPADNVIVALSDLKRGESLTSQTKTIVLNEDIKAKHKFAEEFIPAGGEIIMYGVLVGKAQVDIPVGGLLSTANVKHAAKDFVVKERNLDWNVPDTTSWQGKTFNGYHRADGRVGTANYWIVVPMVFCEIRNLDVIQEALVAPLGYGRNKKYGKQTQKLISLYQAGNSIEEIIQTELEAPDSSAVNERLFPNVDGIKFLNHTGGCGGTSSLRVAGRIYYPSERCRRDGFKPRLPERPTFDA
jgi:altronate hydrolase